MLLHNKVRKIANRFGLLFYLIFSSFLSFGQIIQPALKIKTSGAITDFFIDGSKITLSTDAGTIEEFNLSSGKRIKTEHLPEMVDFMGDPAPTKVYSIDKFDTKILFVTQGNHGFRNLLITENNDTLKVIEANRDKLMIKKARFVNNNHILLGLMSNELILFDIDKKEIIYTSTISAYSFSDFYLNNNKQFVYSSDESGIVHKIDVKDGKIMEEFEGNNVDNVYRLVYKNGVIITAGQDRRVGVYNTITGANYYLQKNFLIYSVALNSDASKGAFTASEENDITVFNVETRNELLKLKGHPSVITKMEFIDEQTLVSVADDHYLMIWKIN